MGCRAENDFQLIFRGSLCPSQNDTCCVYMGIHVHEYTCVEGGTGFFLHHFTLFSETRSLTDSGTPELG